MLKDVMKDAHDRMEKAIESLHQDLRAIRTGRASPALVDRLPIEYYGSPTPLFQLAGISVPEPRLLVIRPYSPKDIGIIQKAIQSSDLGLTPSNDGQVIRLMVPQLTEERRRDLTKQVDRRTEEGRVAIRNVRRDCIDMLRDLEKEKMIDEDELEEGRKEIQKLTDKYIEEADGVGKAKKAEIMEV